MSAKAKVVLKEARTYTLAGMKFVKDVPRIVSGDAVEEFKNNGYFKVTVLKEASSSSEGKSSEKVKSSGEKKKLLKKKKK